MQDPEFMINLQKLALLFSFVVGIATIISAIALCFIATHTAALRRDLLKLRIDAQIASERSASSHNP